VQSQVQIHQKLQSTSVQYISDNSQSQ